DDGADAAVAARLDVVEVAADVEARSVFGERGHADRRRQLRAHEATLHAARALQIELDQRPLVLDLLAVEALEREREQRRDALEDVEIDRREIDGVGDALDDDEPDERRPVEERGAEERAALHAVEGRQRVPLGEADLLVLHGEARLQVREELEAASELALA